VGAEPCGVVRVRVISGGLLAAPVPGHFFVGVLQLEVGGGGIEEQQVHFEVEQVGDGEVHLLFQLAAHGVQPVHRPVAGVVGDLAEPVDVHVVAHPP
jgi:hypothetical protein